MTRATRIPAIALAATAVALEAACLGWLRLGDLQFRLPATLAWFSLAASVYLIAAWLTLRSSRPCSRLRLRLILLAAVGFRLTLLPLAPTLDHRLLREHWEGEIQRAGFNPYEHAPASALFDPIRRPADRAVTRESFASVYPPFTERLLRWSYGLLGDGVRRMKLAGLFFETLTVLLLLRLLRVRGLPRDRILLYAWAPLPLLEFAGQGQIEIAAIFFALLAFHWAARPRLTALAMATALMSSALAWLLLPFWWRAAGPALRRRGPLTLAAIWMALCTLPFLWMHQTIAWTAPGTNLAGFFAHLGPATVYGAIPLLALWVAPWLVVRPTPAPLFFTLAAVWAAAAADYRMAIWFILVPLALLLVWESRRPAPRASAAGGAV